MNQDNNSPFDTVQYIIAFAFLFLIGLTLLTGDFDKYLLLAIGVLSLQLFISVIRFKLLHIIFEVILVILSGITLISLIPFFLFKVFAWLILVIVLVIGMLDLITFKSKGMYQQVYMRTPNFGFKQQNNKTQSKKKSMPKKKKTPEGTVDVEFKEK